MIKVYKSLQQYIANKKNYFTIPQVINLSYKHHALQLWEAEVKLYSTNIVVKFIDEWSWMDIYDNDGTYIGLYRVKSIRPTYQGNDTVLVYKLVHAFSTMLDDVLLLADNGLLGEQNVDSMNSMALIAFIFSKQSTKHWTLVQTKYVGDNTGIKFKRENGLLKYVYEALSEMGGKYSMIFDTTEYPWKAIIVEAKDKVDCRVREEYNLIEYNMDKDYAPYYNRLYVYGERDILGAPIKDQREPIKEPEITSKMSQKQIDAAWKRYNESVKKRKEEDAKRIADDKAAWEKYNSDYKAWSLKQIEMQNARDAALKQRREEIAMGLRPSNGFFAALPPRPSTVPPPEKPHLQTRETGSTGMSIGDLNDGKPYIEDAEEVAKHGVVSRVLEFKDIKDPKLLMDTAKRIFEARQARTIDLRLTAIELNKVLETKIPFDEFHLGQHLLMQTKDLGNLDLVIVGEGKNDVYGNPYDIDLEIVEVSGSAGAGSKPTTVSPTDMMLKRMQKLEKDILYARKSADGKNTIYTGEVAPSDPEINDIWYKTVQDPVTGKYTTEMYIWNGAIWISPFENLKQAMKQVEENEKELDALREEADKSAKELEKNLEVAKTDLMKDVAANRETISNLNKELEVKLTDLQSSIDNANAAAEKAVEEAKKLLSGDIGQLKTELTKQITDEAANIESKLVADTDKKIASTKEDLLAQAKAIGNGVKTELNTQIGELSATIAETKSKADGLTTKISEVKQTVDGFSARLLESEETSEANKTKIAQIQNSVNSLSSTLSDITTTTDGMESRLSVVEQTSTELKTLIESTQENLGGKISNLNSRIDTAEGSIDTIKKTTTDNSTNISKINKRVSTAEGNISTISTNVDGLKTKTNTMQSTVDANKATIASQKKEIDEAGTKITTLTSSLTQTQGQISGIITNYAKKTDLKGLATAEYTQTQIDAKAGEINQTISSQKKEIDTTIAGIKARPTYTIGSDGYWYKDGKKTNTLAKGVNGKDGADGGEFGWNLLLEGDTTITDSTEYRIGIYDLTEKIPEGSVVSLVIRAKGKRGDTKERNSFMTFNTGGSVKALEANLYVDSDGDSEYRTYSLTDKWRVGSMANIRLHLYWGRLTMMTYEPVSIEWVKLVYGANPTMEFAPARSEIYGKDAHLYTGTTAPEDTKQMWFNPDNMTTYVHLDGKWVDMDKLTKHQIETNVQTINTLKQTDESIKSEIAQIKTNAETESTKLNTLERDLSGTKSTISTLTKDLTSAKESISSNTTQITQTNKKIQTIISDYAKKTDISGFVTENRVNTIVEQKAGAIKTSLSSEIATMNEKVNGIKARPVYTIGNDGYWYKDGQKTTTKALGTDGKDGAKGKDGKDVEVYKSETAPSDKSQLWYNTKDKEAYVYYNGSWQNINSTIRSKVNTVSDTVDSHKRTIAALDTNFTAMGRDVAQNVIKISTMKQDLESFKVSIENKDYMSAINQQAGQILFSVSKKSDGTVRSGELLITPTGAYMSSGFIQNAHISDATITDAKIKTLSANKLTAGTIDARQIRVTNIDAANITTGTISGAKSWWNLNTGELQNGWLAEDIPSWSDGTTYTSVQMQDGVFTFRKQGKKFVLLDNKGLQFWGEQYEVWRNEKVSSTSTADTMTEEFGRFTARWWDNEDLKDASGEGTWSSAVGVKNLSMSHMDKGTMTISYLNSEKDAYYPYIIFDNYKKLPFVKTPITVSKEITFKRDIRTANDLVIKPMKFNTFKTDNYASSIFLGRDGDWGLLISAKGVWWVSNGDPWNGSGKSAEERKAAMLRLNSTGDRDYQGGGWNINTDYDNKGTK